MATIKNNNSAIFSLSNKLVKTMKLTRKKAYAEAKRQLSAPAVETKSVTTMTEFTNLLSKNRIKFSYVNSKGREITTTGTTNHSLITKTYVVKGRKTTSAENTVVFFDVRHGIYRPVNVEKITKIF